MATLFITEYSGLGSGPSQVVQGKKIASYTLALSTTPAYSTRPFDPATNIVRLHTDAICSVAIVASTTATAAAITDPRMAADNTEYFGVPNGHVVSAISNS